MLGCAGVDTQQPTTVSDSGLVNRPLTPGTGVQIPAPSTIAVILQQRLWARVWAKVDIPDDTDVCFPWRGALSTKRHGKRPNLTAAGKTYIVARLVCGWFHGPPPTPQHEAGHTCPEGESATCLNPRHLAWQTRAENEQHKALDARRRRGYPDQRDPGDDDDG